MPEGMSDRMPEDMPDKMPEGMSDRMPEDLPVRKCINVMVGITRSKVIVFWQSRLMPFLLFCLSLSLWLPQRGLELQHGLSPFLYLYLGGLETRKGSLLRHNKLIQAVER